MNVISNENSLQSGWLCKWLITDKNNVDYLVCDPHLALCYWMAFLHDLYSNHKHLCWYHSSHIVLETQQQITCSTRHFTEHSSYSKCLTDSMIHFSSFLQLTDRLPKKNMIQTDRRIPSLSTVHQYHVLLNNKILVNTLKISLPEIRGF